MYFNSIYRKFVKFVKDFFCQKLIFLVFKVIEFTTDIPHKVSRSSV